MPPGVKQVLPGGPDGQAMDSKIASLSEELCIGCGICVKKCLFEAITIITSRAIWINIPRIVTLKTFSSCIVLVLVGQNAIGKSTALKTLLGPSTLDGNLGPLPW